LSMVLNGWSAFRCESPAARYFDDGIATSAQGGSDVLSSTCATMLQASQLVSESAGAVGTMVEAWVPMAAVVAPPCMSYGVLAVPAVPIAGSEPYIASVWASPKAPQGSRQPRPSGQHLGQPRGKSRGRRTTTVSESTGAASGSFGNLSSARILSRSVAESHEARAIAAPNNDNACSLGQIQAAAVVASPCRPSSVFVDLSHLVPGKMITSAHRQTRYFRRG